MRMEMASGNYMLQQQQTSLVSRIKTLINNDLKEICKAYGYQVSGNKAQLQPRCIEILQNIVREGDARRFSEFEYRVNNHGRAPHSVPSSNAYVQTNGNPASYHQTSTQNRPVSTNNRSSLTGRYFKVSPFYEILDTALPLHDLPDDIDMPHNRHTVNAKLTLSNDQVQRLRDDRSLRLLLYCGVSSGMSAYTPTDINFPNQLEVKINGDDLKHSYKGLKNKPGSTKPADITDRIRKTTGYQNQISVTYALTTKRFSFIVYMARYIKAESLIERIKTGRVIPKQAVLDEMNRANADPDIATTSVRMSLKDPISTTRITLPIRSTKCTHSQCFDGAFFLQLQEQAPQWSCPVCNKSVPFESLCVDKYFEDILQRTSMSIEQVDIEPDGEWQVIKVEEEDSQPNLMSRKRARASYDDDFDDDELIEVIDDDYRPINGSTSMGRPMISSTASARQGSGFPLNTPPVSSREPSVAQSVASAQRPSNKRPASAVIDLTLSDDDEPPRPAKRQSTSTRHGTSSQTLHLPPQPSLPTPLLPPPPPLDSRSSYHHSGVTDIFRPTNSSERGPSTSRSTPTEQAGLIQGNINGESLRQGHSTSPTLYSRGNSNFNNFSNQTPSRPITSGSGRAGDPPRFPGFALRAPPQSDPGQPEQQQQQQQQENVLLPPMHSSNPTGYYEAWRNDYGHYSSSPSG